MAGDAHDSEADANYDHDLVWIGIVLALCGNTFVAASLNLQKYAHSKLMSAVTRKSYTTSPLWWFGQVLMVFGARSSCPVSVSPPLAPPTYRTRLVLRGGCAVHAYMSVADSLPPPRGARLVLLAEPVDGRKGKPSGLGSAQPLLTSFRSGRQSCLVPRPSSPRKEHGAVLRGACCGVQVSSGTLRHLPLRRRGW